MTDWRKQTLGQVLARAAEDAPQQEALVISGKRMTYGALWREAQRVARGLKALGIKRGDHVAVCMGNSVEWVACYYGAALLGAVTVPVNTRFKPDELKYCLKQSDSVLLITADRFLKIDFIDMLRSICPGIDRVLPDPELPLLRTVVVLGDDVPAAAMSYQSMLAAPGAPAFDPAQEAVTPDDIFLMQYTSGSTSFPKGVMLTHDSMLRDAHCVAARFDVRAGDRYFSARPFYHVAGTTLSLLAALSKRACLLSTPNFDPGQSLRIMSEEKCTLTSGNETMFLMMMQHPDFDQYPLCLRGGWCSGGPGTIKRAVERLGMQFVCTAYGLSEASPNVWMNWWHDPLEMRLTGLGDPHPGLEVRIVDMATGADQPPDTPGEIRVRGWSVMQGYYNMPEQTRKTIDADGWLHTGDLGTTDGKGRYRFVGRAKEMLRVGGENVTPGDVEDVMHQHPAIKQSQVIGVPDARLQEVAAAYVVLNEGASATPQEIIDWCKPRMANFKVPRYVRIIDTFETIGMTGSSKVQKNKVRAQALIDFGLEALEAEQQAAMQRT